MQERIRVNSLAPALDALGLTAHEQEVVSTLLRSPGTTAGEAAKRTRLHRNQVYRALRNLEAAGLVQGQGDRPQRFFLADGMALQGRLATALKHHERATRTLVQAWHSIEGAATPGFCRSFPAGTLAAELDDFCTRQLVASFDMWPLEFPMLVTAPRTVCLPGRLGGMDTRYLEGGPPLRYVLAADACLLLEGPAKAPGGHVVESSAGLSLLRDHFERSWTGAVQGATASVSRPG